jgi:hypothetical protein
MRAADPCTSVCAEECKMTVPRVTRNGDRDHTCIAKRFRDSARRPRDLLPFLFLFFRRRLGGVLLYRFRCRLCRRLRRSSFWLVGLGFFRCFGFGLRRRRGRWGRCGFTLFAFRDRLGRARLSRGLRCNFGRSSAPRRRGWRRGRRRKGLQEFEGLGARAQFAV